jgi:hypothetical protein
LLKKFIKDTMGIKKNVFLSGQIMEKYQGDYRDNNVRKYREQYLGKNKGQFPVIRASTGTNIWANNEQIPGRLHGK